MSEIYASKHQLRAAQARIIYFANLAYHPDAAFAEIERLKQIEEVLINQVRLDEKKPACQ